MGPIPLANGEETRHQPRAAQSWLAQIHPFSFRQQTWSEDKRRLPTMELFSRSSAEPMEPRTSTPLTEPLYRTRPNRQPEADGLKHFTATSKSCRTVETHIRCK